MAEGSLTAREFWKLSPEERWERCGELSEHEAFVMRITDPGNAEKRVYVPCNDCVHRFGIETACKAHPNGMTQEDIQAVINDHNYACGNGYKFEKRK